MSPPTIRALRALLSTSFMQAFRDPILWGLSLALLLFSLWWGFFSYSGGPFLPRGFDLQWSFLGCLFWLLLRFPSAYEGEMHAPGWSRWQDWASIGSVVSGFGVLYLPLKIEQLVFVGVQKDLVFHVELLRFFAVLVLLAFSSLLAVRSSSRKTWFWIVGFAILSDVLYEVYPGWRLFPVSLGVVLVLGLIFWKRIPLERE